MGLGQGWPSGTPKTTGIPSELETSVKAKRQSDAVIEIMLYLLKAQKILNEYMFSKEIYLFVYSLSKFSLDVYYVSGICTRSRGYKDGNTLGMYH